MKRLIFFLLLGSFIVLSSCGGIKTMSAGQENEAFLEFFGAPKSYPDGVEVTLDNKTTFMASVHSEKVAYMKGEVYAISTGAHTIKVSHKGQVLYEKQIFVATQETKKIVLP